MRNATAAAAIAIALSSLLGAALDAAAQTTRDPRGAAGKAPAKPQFAEDDRVFMMKAAADGIAAVELGKVAQQKGTHAAVKKFAAYRVAEHAKASEELKALAAGKRVSLPSAPSREQQGQVEKMQKLSGAEFDRAYVQHMVADHKKAIDLFTRASHDAKDADVKAYAAKTLPALQEHQKMAQAAEAAVKKAPRPPTKK
ncbi:MAG: DUF4142 domain-containing protein [Usitatibacter sp.]